MLRPLMLACALGCLAWQPAFSQNSPAPSRPVKEVTERADAAKIEFVAFDFQQPTLMGELRVHYVEIRGEPSMGEEYGVDASIGGQEAIATLLFEAIGADGALLQMIPMVADSIGVAGDHNFIGLMTVPSQPFRVRLSGDDVYGRRFTRLSRLIRPVVEPRKKVEYPGIPPELLVLLEPRFDEVRAERRALVLGSPAGSFALPRTRIFDVRYAPLMSDTGNPLGLTVTFGAEFSQAGRYNPALHLYAEDTPDFLFGRHPLRPLRSSIRPVPHDPHEPLKEAKAATIASLHYSPDFLYMAGLQYQFTVDMAPDFVGVLQDGFTPCLWKQPPLPGEDPKAFARRVAREEPTAYKVSIGGWETFEGRIDGFYGEGALFRGFASQGLADCEPPRYR